MTPAIEAKVREIVAKAANPLDAAAIRRQLKGEFAIKAKQKDAFDQWLATLGGFIVWPAANAKSGPRYWTRTAEDVAEAAILKAATAKAELPKKLVAVAAKGKSGYPKDRAEALLARLEAEGKLHRQPFFAESKYKLTATLHEDARAVLHRALGVIERALRALGDPPAGPQMAVAADQRVVDQKILDALAQLEPKKGLLVTAPRLRRAVPELSKQAFDEAVMRLYRAEKVLLHRHSGPFLLPADERNALVESGDSFYVGICWNTGEE